MHILKSQFDHNIASNLGGAIYYFKLESDSNNLSMTETVIQYN